MFGIDKGFGPVLRGEAGQIGARLPELRVELAPARVGSLWGGIIGAAVLLTAQTLLSDLRLLGTSLFASAPFVTRLTERWQLWVGVLFILAVFFFPRGVIGMLKAARSARKDARR